MKSYELKSQGSDLIFWHNNEGLQIPKEGVEGEVDVKFDSYFDFDTLIDGLEASMKKKFKYRAHLWLKYDLTTILNSNSKSLMRTSYLRLTKQTAWFFSLSRICTVDSIRAI
jgi:hypothetical protein